MVWKEIYFQEIHAQETHVFSTIYRFVKPTFLLPRGTLLCDRVEAQAYAWVTSLDEISLPQTKLDGVQGCKASD